MKKALFTLSLCLIASICFSQPTSEVENNLATENGAGRLIITRILDGQNLHFQRNLEKTAFTLRVVPGDSIRFGCNDCWKLLQTEKNGKSSLAVSIVSENGTQKLTSEDFQNGWVKVNSSNGSFKLALEHGGGGKGSFTIDQLRVWQKTEEKK